MSEYHGVRPVSYNESIVPAARRAAAAALIACVLAGTGRAATPGLPIAQPDLAVEAMRFAEPLVPTIPTSAAEDAALLAAIRRAHAATAPDDVSALAAFVADYPESGWQLAVLTNLGLSYLHTGYVSRALAAFDRAWRAGQSASERHAHALADRAVGELLRLHAGLAHEDAVAALLAETATRGLGGQASEWRAGAAEELQALRDKRGIPCGLTALRTLLILGHASAERMAVLDAYEPGPQGMPLAEVGRLATRAALPHRLVERHAGEPVPVPSIMHWRVRHFSAIVGFRDGRYELADTTFGQPTLWLTRAAIDAESSGYFLVPGAVPGTPWRDVPPDEAAQVRGR